MELATSILGTVFKSVEILIFIKQKREEAGKIDSEIIEGINTLWTLESLMREIKANSIDNDVDAHSALERSKLIMDRIKAKLENEKLVKERYKKSQRFWKSVLRFWKNLYKDIQELRNEIGIIYRHIEQIGATMNGISEVRRSIIHEHSLTRKLIKEHIDLMDQRLVNANIQQVAQEGHHTVVVFETAADSEDPEATTGVDQEASGEFGASRLARGDQEATLGGEDPVDPVYAVVS